MKFTKKLLTVLPVTAIGCLTPVVVSGCSCGTSYSINYGDTINCKDKNAKEYHSVEDVKNAANNHKQVYDQDKKSESQLLKFEGEKNQQFFYWDLVYSAANNGIQFTLSWTFTDATKKAFKEGNFNGVAFDTLSYAFNSSGKVEIKINTTTIESYAYHLVERA